MQFVDTKSGMQLVGSEHAISGMKVDVEVGVVHMLSIEYYTIALLQFVLSLQNYLQYEYN